MRGRAKENTKQRAEMNDSTSYPSRSDIYRKSSWEVIPINPMCLKMKLIGYLFSENGLAERSSLSLSAWVMMSVGGLKQN